MLQFRFYYYILLFAACSILRVSSQLAIYTTAILNRTDDAQIFFFSGVLLLLRFRFRHMWLIFL